MDHWLGLAGVLIGAVITLATQLLAGRHEDRRLEAQRHQKDFDELVDLYQDVILVLERTSRAFGTGTEEHSEEMIRLRARLRFRSTLAIRTQFNVVGEALDEWATQARLALPKRVGDGTMVVISSTDRAHEVTAQSLFPAFTEGFEQLQEMMREHLDRFRASGQMSRASMLTRAKE